MKVLRLKLYQPTANYRPHYSMGRVRHTYPLPPPSSVLGLIHRVVGAKPGDNYRQPGKTINGMDLAILGKYEGIGWDYQWFLKPVKNTNENIIFTSSLSPLKDIKFTQVPGKVQLLTDVELIIYISLKNEAIKMLNRMANNKPVDDLEKALEFIKKKFIKENEEILYLGRAEDLLIVEKAEVVELKKLEKGKETPNLKTYSQWIPVEDAQQYEIEGVIYNLPGYYEKRKIKAKNWVIRDFNFHPCVYAEPQEIPEFEEDFEHSENLWIDKDIPVWFLNLSKEG